MVMKYCGAMLATLSLVACNASAPSDAVAQRPAAERPAVSPAGTPSVHKGGTPKSVGRLWWLNAIDRKKACTSDGAGFSITRSPGTREMRRGEIKSPRVLK